MWTLFRQQQQCGAQLHARPGAGEKGARQPGEAPAEAVEGREAQDHEQAGGRPQPGDYPASAIENRDGDNTPSAPDPRVEWDDVVQPERAKQQGDEDFDDLPLPEGK